MLTLLNKIFTWWNRDTFGTRLKTIFYGKLVGNDELGNKYYESKEGKRWVIYADIIDASKIPVESLPTNFPKNIVFNFVPRVS